MNNLQEPLSSPLRKFLRVLEQHEGLTYEELARHAGLSKRQIRRHLTDLREHYGYHIREEQDGRYKRFYLAEESRQRLRPDVKLSEEEALALTIGLRAAHAMLGSTPLRRPLSDALEHLTDHFTPQIDFVELDAQDDRWYFRAIANNRIDPGAFRPLLIALEHQETIRFTYAKPGSEPEVRTVDPYCFAVDGNAIILVGYCHSRKALRDFALTRISDPTATDTYFDRLDDFDPAVYYGDRFGALAGEKMHVVRLRAEPEVAHLFEEREYHPSQDIEHVEDDGAVLVSFQAQSLSSFRSFVQSWGHRVTVLEPPELVDLIQAEARVVAARYPARSDAS